MLKYRIFVIGFNGTLWDAHGLEIIPEDIDFDCIDDAVYQLSRWIDNGLAQSYRNYVFLTVYKP